jgi:chemotaxis response regulator CheB
MPKKILVVDDSALMRRVLCDIIDTDIRFQVADRAKDGLEAFDLLSRNSYDAVVLDPYVSIYYITQQSSHECRVINNQYFFWH